MRLNEFSNEKLSQYKTAAAADAKKADAAGDFARGNRRFKGINTATKKQFDNDAKKQGVAEEEIEKNHWYDAGKQDAEEGKRPNPRTRLKTMQDKQARHPEEVYHYMNGYKSVKPGVAEDDDAVAAFVARGGEIQQLKPQRGPKRSGVGFASKHIGSGSGRGTTKGKVSGLGANTGKAGKPVVTAEQGVAEAVDIGQEWMSDTELDQYVPDRLQQQWRELLGYDRNGNPSALWANLTGGYEPDVNDPQHRALMVKVANKWFAAKKIPNVKFFDVKDADDELEWLVQIGQQGVAEGEKHGLYYNVNKRKKAGTSRPANSPKAPTAQAWKDAAKTAKNESVAEDSLSAMRRLAGVTTPPPAAAPNGPRQYRHMPTAVQPR
jgi:hypothetical protein